MASRLIKMLPASFDTATSYSLVSPVRTGISPSSDTHSGSSGSSWGKMTEARLVGSGVRLRAKGEPPTMADTMATTWAGNMVDQGGCVMPGGAGGMISGLFRAGGRWGASSARCLAGRPGQLVQLDGPCRHRARLCRSAYVRTWRPG